MQTDFLHNTFKINQESLGTFTVIVHKIGLSVSMVTNSLPGIMEFEVLINSPNFSLCLSENTSKTV